MQGNTCFTIRHQGKNLSHITILSIDLIKDVMADLGGKHSVKMLRIYSVLDKRRIFKHVSVYFIHSVSYPLFL